MASTEPVPADQALADRSVLLASRVLLPSARPNPPAAPRGAYRRPGQPRPGRPAPGSLSGNFRRFRDVGRLLAALALFRGKLPIKNPADRIPALFPVEEFFS